MRELVETARAFVGRWRDQRDPASLAFDAAYGTETAAFDLGNYEPSSPLVAGEVLDAVEAALGPCVGQASLIDLGCGKGRVLLLAAHRGFARVIGVELRPGLVDVCRRNIAAFSARYPTVRPPDVVWGDAADVVLPPGIRVLYLYNPFPRDTLAAVLAREAGDAWLAYVHPRDEALARGAGFVEVARGTTDPAWVLLHRPG